MLDQGRCAPRSGHFWPFLTPPIDSTVKNTPRVSLGIQCSYPINVYTLATFKNTKCSFTHKNSDFAQFDWVLTCFRLYLILKWVENSWAQYDYLRSKLVKVHKPKKSTEQWLYVWKCSVCPFILNFYLFLGISDPFFCLKLLWGPYIL